MRLAGSRRIPAATAVTVAGLATACTVAGTVAPASATTIVHAKYKVTGSTFLKAPNAVLPLGPGKLATNVNLGTGKITGTLTMPDATLTFKQFGLIPVTATTHFINNGPTTGKVNINTGAVTTTSHITFQIVSLSVAGLPIPVGPSCESSGPAVIQVASQPGFNVLSGGKLAGTYAIPQFANCGIVTALINATLTGPGNTITLKLGKAKLG